MESEWEREKQKLLTGLVDSADDTLGFLQQSDVSLWNSFYYGSVKFVEVSVFVIFVHLAIFFLFLAAYLKLNFFGKYCITEIIVTLLFVGGCCFSANIFRALFPEHWRIDIYD